MSPPWARAKTPDCAYILIAAGRVCSPTRPAFRDWLPAATTFTPVSEALAREVTAAARERAVALGSPEDSVATNRAHDDAAFKLLRRHRRGALDLFLDTDRTDKGLKPILLVNVNTPGSVDVSAIKRGWLWVDGKIGIILASRSVLSALAGKSLADRDYSDPESTRAADEQKKREFLEWAEDEKKKHGSYPPMEKSKKGARDRRRLGRSEGRKSRYRPGMGQRLGLGARAGASSQ